MTAKKITANRLLIIIRSNNWRDQSAGTVEIWLDQKPVHHCRSAENRSLSTSGQLPAPYWTTVSSVSVLRRRWRDGTASSTLLPITRAGTIIHQLQYINSTDPWRMWFFLELIRAVTPPPQLGIRERKSNKKRAVNESKTTLKRTAYVCVFFNDLYMYNWQWSWRLSK